MKHKTEVEQLVLKEKWVLVNPEPILDGNFTQAGIWVPTTGKEKTEPKYGDVIKIGEDVTEVEIGDVVLLMGISAGAVSFDKKDYFIVRSDKLIAIIPKEK